MNASPYPRTTVIIPCYHVREKVEQVISSIPAWVEQIIVVDDKCPQESWRIVERLQEHDKRIALIRHSVNQGVGGAMVTGYKAGLAGPCEIFVKMDGDGQMDPADLPRIVEPIAVGRADYAKGNRFRDFTTLRSMPGLRLFGNSALSFLVKAASGYWNILDPTNGYTAIHRRILEQMPLDRVSKRYFFESDMLIRMNPLDAAVADVPIKAKYDDEHSSLRISRTLLEFPTKLLRGLVRRVFLKYFVYDFNMASVYILVGAPLMLFGIIFGAWEWFDSFRTGRPKTAGTIMVAALPIILAFQMLLQAIQIDMDRAPRLRRNGNPTFKRED